MHKDVIEDMLDNIVGVWTHGGTYLGIKRDDQAVLRHRDHGTLIFIGGEEFGDPHRSVIVETDDIAAIRVDMS